MIEFYRYQIKLFPELLAHGLVKFLYNLQECSFRLNKVVMLVFQELISLRQILIILDGIDIDVPKFADLLFQGQDLLFKAAQIRIFLVPKRQGRIVRELVFLPHILGLGIQPLFQPLPLTVQPKDLLVQTASLLRERHSFLKEFLLSC